MPPYSGAMARSKPTDATAPSGKAGRGPKDGGRGRSAGSTAAGASGKAPKLDKKGQPKIGRLKKLGNNVRMIKQAYTLTQKNDPRLPWVLLIAFVVVAAVIELIGVLLDSPFVFLPLALLAGGLAALIIFGRRAQGSAYRQVEGQPGAAAWVLEGMRGGWRGDAGGARTPPLGAGPPGVGPPRGVLGAAGSPDPTPRRLAPGKKGPA